MVRCKPPNLEAPILEDKLYSSDILEALLKAKARTPRVGGRALDLSAKPPKPPNP